MDREMELAHLEQAEQDLADAYRRIERQRRLIADLRHGGHPADAAEKLLETMLTVMHAMEGHRDVILEMLSQEHL